MDDLTNNHGVTLSLRNLADASASESSRLVTDMDRLPVSPDHVVASGACALALQIFGSDNQNKARGRSHHESELDYLSEAVRFDRNNIPIVFDCVGGYPLKNRHWEGAQDALVELRKVAHRVPTKRILYQGRGYPVVTGPPLLFDLIETFVHRIGYWHFAHEDIRHDGMRSSIATFVLLLHALILAAPSRPSLALEFHSIWKDRLWDATCHAMIDSPRFTAVRPFIQWFCQFRNLGRYSHLAARHLSTQGRRPTRVQNTSETEQLRHSIEQSLIRLRGLLEPLTVGESARLPYEFSFIFDDLESDFVFDHLYDRPPLYEQSFVHDPPEFADTNQVKSESWTSARDRLGPSTRTSSAAAVETRGRRRRLSTSSVSSLE